MNKEIDCECLYVASKFIHAVLMTYPNDGFISHINSCHLSAEWKKMFPEFCFCDELDSFLNKWSGTEKEIENLQYDYTCLFIGLGKPLAPLWGSVYTNRHNILNGESTLKLKEFLFKNDINVITNEHEPVDNLGLIFLVVSQIFEDALNNKKEPKVSILKELMVSHTLPWCYRCVELISINAKSDFYIAVAEMITNLLNKIVDYLCIDFEAVESYR